MVKSWQNLIIFIFALFICTLLSSFLASFFSFKGAIVSDTLFYILNGVTAQLIIFMGASILYFKITKIEFRQYINIQSLSKKDWLLTMLYFGLAIGLTIAVSPLSAIIETTYPNHDWIQYQKEVSEIQNKVIGELRGFKIVLAIGAFALLPSIAEEIAFRGILYRVFKDLAKRKHLAMFLSAFVFAIFHFQVLSFLPIFIVGFLLAAIYEKTNNLLPGIILHFSFNALQIIFWQA